MPSLPMRVPAATPRYFFFLSSCGRDLAQRPEQLGGQVLVRIGAQEQLLDVDAGELVLALLEVVERGARDVGLDRHVGVRRLRDALDHAPVDRPRRHAEHVAEAAEAAAQRRLGRRDRRHGNRLRAARRADEHAPLAALGARVAALLLAAGALERAQLVGGGEARALRARARGAVAVGDLQLGVRQAARDDLDDRRDARAHEPVAVAVDDVAARRLDLDLAHAVLARLGHVVLAREHLQEPQAEEDDREQHEREAAEHGHAHRELRRDRGAALFEVGWAQARRDRAEPAGRVRAPAAAARVVGQERREDAADEQVDRQREQRVEDDREQDLAHEQQRDRRVDAEQELHDGEADA